MRGKPSATVNPSALTRRVGRFKVEPRVEYAEARRAVWLDFARSLFVSRLDSLLMFTPIEFDSAEVED